MGEVGCLKDGHFQNLQVGGAIVRKTPQTLFKWDYISCPTPLISNIAGASGAHGVMGDGELFSIFFPGVNGEIYPCQCCNIAAYSVAASGYFVEGTMPVTTGLGITVDTNLIAGGLNLQGDAATTDNTGIEIILNGTQFGGGAACTVGTHAMTFDATFYSDDWTDQDVVIIGFRKVQSFDSTHGAALANAAGDPKYTDFAALGCQSPDDVQMAVSLNATPVFRDSLDVCGAGAGNHRFRMEITSSGVTSFKHVGAAVMDAGTLVAPTQDLAAVHTFDSGDVLVPYIVIQNTGQNSGCYLKSATVTRTPGISYTN